MDRRRRRYAQSDLDANVGRAPRAGADRDRRRRRLVGRCARGAGVRLSRGAHAQSFAAHLSDHDRRAAALNRRHSGAPVGAASPQFVIPLEPRSRREAQSIITAVVMESEFAGFGPRAGMTSEVCTPVDIIYLLSSRITRSMPFTTRATFSASTLSGVSLGRW